MAFYTGHTEQTKGSGGGGGIWLKQQLRVNKVPQMHQVQSIKQNHEQVCQSNLSWFEPEAKSCWVLHQTSSVIFKH